MDTLLWLRVGVAAVADLSIASICGVLLATVWLCDQKVRLPLRWYAATLCLATWAQLLLIAATFSGSVSLRAILAMMPDLLETHMGRVPLNVAMLSLALLLWVWSCRRRSLHLTGTAVLLVGLVTFRSATGHAAVDGDFSRAELLEWIHLVAMALWSGGVLISGLLVVPALQEDGDPQLRSYVEALSRVSTWAVGLVVVSGVWKGYLAVDGDLHLWREGSWGELLAAKMVCVAAVLGLGAWNRWMLVRDRHWEEKVVVRTLRMEAIGMLTIVVLSAALANAAPPGN